MEIDYKGMTLPLARAMQEKFRERLNFENFDLSAVKTIAGADISFNKNSTTMFGAIVILSFPGMKLQSYALAAGETDFPYISGYLGFREIPTLYKAWQSLKVKPDVTILDGQGILHPRRMGIASHFGVLTESAAIGCAKTSLYGFYEEPQLSKYASSEVYEKNTLTHIGYALRSKNAAKPVYISPGYGLDLEQSLAVVKKCIGAYRIPEPTRIAHNIVNEFRTGKLTAGFHTMDHPQELF